MKEINELLKEKYWLVRENSTGIQLVRNINGKPVMVNLRKEPGNKKYHLIFPSYIFQSSISHFSPSENEFRFCRNKKILISLVKILKKSAAWNLINNKDFIAINSANRKSNKDRIRKELEDLYALKYKNGKLVKDSNQC